MNICIHIYVYIYVCGCVNRQRYLRKICRFEIEGSRVHVCIAHDVYLQCVAVFCSVLQCVAVCCSVLQCVAVCCSVL